MTDLDLAIGVGAEPPPLPSEAPSPRRARRKRREIALRLSIAWVVLVLLAAITASWLPLKDPLADELTRKLVQVPKKELDRRIERSKTKRKK